MVEFDILYSAGYLIESLKRYRLTRWWRQGWRGLEFLLAMALVGCGVFFIRAHFLVPSLIIGGLLGALLLGPPIDNWLIQKNFKKSPYRNDRVHVCLSEKGVIGNGAKSQTRLDWAAFTAARRFADGVLLFQGPNLFSWLPFEQMVSGGISELDELVRANIGDFREI